MPEPGDVTQMLLGWGKGDREALDQLLPVVYKELRRLAQSYLKSERPNHTLQATALVNEAYLRLVDEEHRHVENRSQFFAVAAQAMRRILIDHARRKRSEKRGGGVAPVTLDEGKGAPSEDPVDVLALDLALRELAEVDPRQARVVELRYFGGLSIEETAKVLEISTATVAREWTLARAWLRLQLGGE
jgi:RNA polymerase sigma factor (TIGR02999 family)